MQHENENLVEAKKLIIVFGMQASGKTSFIKMLISPS
jgi:GTPase SAR1 family protein